MAAGLSQMVSEIYEPIYTCIFYFPLCVDCLSICQFLSFVYQLWFNSDVYICWFIIRKSFYICMYFQRRAFLIIIAWIWILLIGFCTNKLLLSEFKVSSKGVFRWCLDHHGCIKIEIDLLFIKFLDEGYMSLDIWSKT